MNRSAYTQPNQDPLAPSVDNGIKPQPCPVPSLWPLSGSGETRSFECKESIHILIPGFLVITVVVVGIMYGPDAMNSPNSDHQYVGYMKLVAIIVAVAIVTSGCGMVRVINFPQDFVQFSLTFAVVMALVSMSVFIFCDSWSSLLGFLYASVSFSNTVCAGKTSSVNARLILSCAVIRENMAVTVFAWLVAFIAGLWSIIFTYAYWGVYNHTYKCDDESNTYKCETESNECSEPAHVWLILLLVAYILVTQVVQNLVFVTVAGTVGQWWLTPPEATNLRTRAANRSFLRAVTSSFGSVCFGSFALPIAGLWVMLLGSARRDDDQAGGEGEGEISERLAQRCCWCKRPFEESCNKWAFIYVGIYGDPFLKSGQRVNEVFKEKGWEAITADRLVPQVLLKVSITFGFSIGAFSLILLERANLFEGAAGNQKFLGYILSSFIGTLIASIFMTPICAATNAMLVLYAEAPAELRQYHPEFNKLLEENWSAAYPETVETPLVKDDPTLDLQFYG